MDGLSAIGTNGSAAYQAAAKAAGRAGQGEAPGPSFASVVKDAMGDTNRLQQEADQMVGKLGAGEITDVHQVMLAMNRADLSFRMMLEVRNKLLDAYQEVMRMQV